MSKVAWIIGGLSTGPISFSFTATSAGICAIACPAAVRSTATAILIRMASIP
jgi:hypothetical protein